MAGGAPAALSTFFHRFASKGVTPCTAFWSQTLAFIEESDLRPASPQPQVIVQARRSLLVPALLVILILVIAALAVVVALPYLRTDDTAKPSEQAVAATEIEPAMLITPTGRKLDVVEFGGFVFEITRLAYSNHPRARTVTVTAPGIPPQMGVFHVGESFAGGKVRVVEITSSSVVLEADGTQKVFPINGSDPSEIWDRGGTGTQIIPPTDPGAIPNLPPGQTRPPKDPREEIDAEQPTEADPAGDKPSIDSIEDLPDIREKSLPRLEYQKLVRALPDDFARDFVLAIAIERDTRMVYGLEIKNLVADSFYYAHGLELGDVILAINDQPVASIRELDSVLKSNAFREEIAIEVEREGGLVTFVFFPGVTD
jgi:type II secretory pathway component PulC